MSSSSVDNVRFGYLKNTYLNYTFLIGVEKNNDDARRNYFSSNFHDLIGEILNLHQVHHRSDQD